MSVYGDGPEPGRLMVTEMPIMIQAAGGQAYHLQSPQRKVDDFWRKFTTKAPGKATTILPKNELAERIAKRAAAKDLAGGSPKTATTSYEDAAALCRAKVAQIVAECHRINQKYRDPHFDLDFDLRSGSRDCLESLSKDSADYSSDEEDIIQMRSRSGSRSGSRSPSPDDRRRRRRRRRLEFGVGEEPAQGRKAFGRWPGAQFCPKSVKRVGEIFDDPKFYIDGPTANDVRQGRDGDCWLMAGLCTLSNKPGLIERVCVARDEDVGVYGFVFHRDGEWISEIIDDKLYLIKPDFDEARMGRRMNIERALWDDIERPDAEEKYRKTYQSNSSALFFASCENSNETWLPLLEKAYAKAHGDYAAIEGGFTGEGIEDLTGGVTTELVTMDILNKERFWEELMRVNKDFLFGCTTGLWGLGYGERKGIQEGHAYSVMRAVEIDGERLLLLKNPWGKGEWTGPWSDGSKEWTAEWLTKLDHRFGDDGAFWISYKDLLRKYQTFDRTRLFGPEWKITSMWTTLNVSWSRDYHDTKFTFTLAKAGPVVIVLSQLDDRYFRGLEGEYFFELGFRVHKAGEEDYIVRTHTTYYMKRSCNVELDLEAGEYTVLVKVDAEREEGVLRPEDVVRLNVKKRREKLLRIGLAYDLAHIKARVVETAEEKAAREAYVKYRKEKHREHIRKAVMKGKHRDYYMERKKWSDHRKEQRWQRELQKKRAEKREAKRQAKLEEKAKADREEELKRSEGEAQREEAKGAEESKPENSGAPEDQPTDGLKGEAKQATAEASEREEAASVPENTPPTSASQSVDVEGKPEGAATVDRPETESALTETAPAPAPEQPLDDTPKQAETSTLAIRVPNIQTAPKGAPPTPAATPYPERPASDPRLEEKLRAVFQVVTGFQKELEGLLGGGPAKLGDGPARPSDEPVSGEEDPVSEADDQEDPDAESPQHQHPRNRRGPRGPRGRRFRGPPPPHNNRMLHPHHPPVHFRGPSPPPPPNARNRNTSRGGAPFPPPPQSIGSRSRSRPPHGNGRRGGGPPPGPIFYDGPGPVPGPGPGPDCESESEDLGLDDDDLCSVRSVSDVSEAALDYIIQNHHGGDRDRRGGDGRVGGPVGRGGQGEMDEFERDPWNAVAVVGLRIYYRVDGEAKEGEEGGEEGVKLRVVRPNRWEVGDDEESSSSSEEEEGEEKGERDETTVLDVDDSAKDVVAVTAG